MTKAVFPARALEGSRESITVDSKTHQAAPQIGTDPLRRVVDPHQAGEHLGVVVGIGVVVDHWRGSKPSHLSVAAGLQEGGIEPEKGFVTPPDRSRAPTLSSSFRIRS